MLPHESPSRTTRANEYVFSTPPGQRNNTWLPLFLGSPTAGAPIVPAGFDPLFGGIAFETPTSVTADVYAQPSSVRRQLFPDATPARLPHHVLDSSSEDSSSMSSESDDDSSSVHSESGEETGADDRDYDIEDEYSDTVDDTANIFQILGEDGMPFDHN